MMMRFEVPRRFAHATLTLDEGLCYYLTDKPIWKTAKNILKTELFDCVGTSSCYTVQ